MALDFISQYTQDNVLVWSQKEKITSDIQIELRRVLHFKIPMNKTSLLFVRLNTLEVNSLKIIWQWLLPKWSQQAPQYLHSAAIATLFALNQSQHNPFKTNNISTLSCNSSIYLHLRFMASISLVFLFSNILVRFSHLISSSPKNKICFTRPIVGINLGKCKPHADKYPYILASWVIWSDPLFSTTISEFYHYWQLFFLWYLKFKTLTI